ncbi:helix-turn-helix domain-containing protein [Pantoea sp. ME81]|uniref:helix-turn-helix domain-containing protein n=1 Tax=Pantoea sp. ME81 TaxID=2743935 RepID=UPI0015F3DA71|nr:helix-turn-helix domain-containing protein [Pantoea sp. ME81]
MSNLNRAIKCIGVPQVAAACGISQRAVYKWLKKGSLPSTEFYGKTSYANIIERLSKGRFTAEKLLDESRASLLSN